MGIIILTSKPTPSETTDITKALDGYIKLAVDIENGIAAGGGQLHADCEKILLEKGSKQENVWGGGYDTETGDIDTMAFINIRPTQNNDHRWNTSYDV